MTVFDLFKEDSYTYLTISRGTIYGNKITSETSLKGVIKVRQGMNQGDMEQATSGITIHAHPEDFTDFDEIVGNGVRYNGSTYRIQGITVGKNFETDAVEHITMTLARETELTEEEL